MSNIQLIDDKPTGFVSSMKTMLGATAICSIVAFVSTNSAAATATANLQVTAKVEKSCTINAGLLAFGAYTGTLSTTSGIITVKCTNSTPFNIGLNQGIGPGGTTTTRIMTGVGNSTLQYTLWRDSARTQNWGNTVGTDTYLGSGTGSEVQVPVYGMIAAGLTPPPGNYSDTVVATITF